MFKEVWYIFIWIMQILNVLKGFLAHLLSFNMSQTWEKIFIQILCYYTVVLSLSMQMVIQWALKLCSKSYRNLEMISINLFTFFFLEEIMSKIWRAATLHCSMLPDCTCSSVILEKLGLSSALQRLTNCSVTRQTEC